MCRFQGRDHRLIAISFGEIQGEKSCTAASSDWYCIRSSWAAARGPLCEMTRLYLGLEFDAQVQVVLEPDAVPSAPWHTLHLSFETTTRRGCKVPVRANS